MSINLNVERIITSDAKVTPSSIHVEATATNTVHAELKTGSLTKYGGPYISYPKPQAQVFSTKNRLMTDNFVVNEILLHEAPNDFGTTITIGE